MANVTPQSLSSFEFYELLTKKITLFAIAVQPSLGWEVSPHAQTTTSHSAAAQQCASGLFPAGATDCCREAKYDFSLGRQPVHWDRQMKSITGVFSPNWSGPWISLSLDGWFSQRCCSFQF